MDMQRDGTKPDSVTFTSILMQRDVNIWDEPWVPDMPNFMVQGMNGAKEKAVLVSELIDHQNRTWKFSLLAELFTPIEIQAILRINIPTNTDHDSLVWTKTKEDKFSTNKSLYHSIVQEEELPSTSRDSHLNRNWSKFWNCKRLSPRVLNFVWRLLHDGIPVGLKLSPFLDDIDTGCPFCHEQVEDRDHVFLRCNFARSIWFLSPLNLRTTELDMGLVDLIWSWISNLHEEHLHLAFHLLRSLWKARCKLVFEKVATNAAQVVATAVKRNDDYLKPSLNEPSITHSSEECTELPRWSAPPDGVVKFNVDGGSKDGCISAGVVGRDASGNSIWCATKVTKIGSY